MATTSSSAPQIRVFRRPLEDQTSRKRPNSNSTSFFIKNYSIRFDSSITMGWDGAGLTGSPESSLIHSPGDTRRTRYIRGKLLRSDGWRTGIISCRAGDHTRAFNPSSEPVINNCELCVPTFPFSPGPGYLLVCNTITNTLLCRSLPRSRMTPSTASFRSPTSRWAAGRPRTRACEACSAGSAHDDPNLRF